MKSLEERVLDKIDRSGGDEQCWLWIGAKYTERANPRFLIYGYILIEKRQHLAHRVAYEVLVGPIPTGYEIDHLCRTPLCCNPRHLEAVTGRTNKLRGAGACALNAQKRACPQGHLYSPSNTAVGRRGTGSTFRVCRECRKAVHHKYRLKLKRMAV